MRNVISEVAILLDDYDRAISWFTDQLDFHLIEDTDLGSGKRWVRVGPRKAGGTALLLARADTRNQRERIGNQAGGRVFLFLATDDFWTDYRRMLDRGVEFCQAPREETYGTVVVFRDLYGNRWDLIQRNHTKESP